MALSTNQKDGHKIPPETQTVLGIYLEPYAQDPRVNTSVTGLQHCVLQGLPRDKSTPCDQLINPNTRPDPSSTRPDPSSIRLFSTPSPSASSQAEGLSERLEDSQGTGTKGMRVRDQWDCLGIKGKGGEQPGEQEREGGWLSAELL